MTKRSSAVGSSFDGFLAEEGLLETVRAVALRRVVGWQLAADVVECKNPSHSMLDLLRQGADSGLSLESLDQPLPPRIVGRRKKRP